MKKFFMFIIICFSFNPGFCVSANQSPDNPGMEQLRKNLITIIQKGRSDDENINKILLQLKPDGSFSDVDYSDLTPGTWALTSHLSRLLAMAICWKSPQSSWFNSPKLKAPLFDVLNFWLTNDFLNPNWWYREIGVPRIIGQTMVLLKENLSEQEIAAGLTILNRSKISKTGQNKVWLAQNVIYRSLLTNDVKQIEFAAQSIADEIIISEKEGIQPDFSFHQHGPQQQFGNYGLSFAGDMLNLAIIFEGTPFSFSNAKTEILRNYLSKGLKWIIWKDRFDISACGRQLFPNTQIGKARVLTNIFLNMPKVDPLFKEQYESALKPFNGNIHFWRSDMTIHRRSEFYSSVKMASNRVVGSESCNSENIQGYHLGDGATFYYSSGDEYTDIFPFWDWKKIPGTTAIQDDRVLPVLTEAGYRIKSDFVGGVSDNLNGVSAMQYYRDSLSATKSWFFFEDAIVCLGYGITTDRNQVVTTSVNQSLLKSDVLVSQRGKNIIVKNGIQELQKVDWVLQDNWGYYFPGSANINLENRSRTGAWNRVVAPMSDKVLNADIFQVWINHGSRPQQGSYSYVVLPNATNENIKKRGSELKILSNTVDIQAVGIRDGSMYGIVFYKSGKFKISPEQSIATDTPCIIYYTSKGGKEALNISDPTHLQSNIKLSLSGKSKFKEGGQVSYDQTKKVTTISILLPKGGEAGKTVTIQ